MKFSILIIACSALFTLSNCNKNDGTTTTATSTTAVCDGSSPTYDSYVRSIMVNNCNSCHGSGSNDGDFSTYQLLSESVVDGKFEKEVMEDKTMPTAAPLSQSDLDKLKCWIENGHPEN